MIWTIYFWQTATVNSHLPQTSCLKQHRVASKDVRITWHPFTGEGELHSKRLPGLGKLPSFIVYSFFSHTCTWQSDYLFAKLRRGDDGNDKSICVCVLCVMWLYNMQLNEVWMSFWVHLLHGEKIRLSFRILIFDMNLIINKFLKRLFVKLILSDKSDTS